MDLHGRDLDRFQRIQNGHAGVGISGGIDDDAVIDPVGLLDGVHQRPLVVALELVHPDPQRRSRFPEQGKQRLKIRLAVNIRLPQAQQVDIRPVQHQNFHFIASRIVFSVLSKAPLLSKVRSTKAAYRGSRWAAISDRSLARDKGRPSLGSLPMSRRSRRMRPF